MTAAPSPTVCFGLRISIQMAPMGALNILQVILQVLPRGTVGQLMDKRRYLEFRRPLVHPHDCKALFRTHAVDGGVLRGSRRSCPQSFQLLGHLLQLLLFDVIQPHEYLRQ